MEDISNDSNLQLADRKRIINNKEYSLNKETNNHKDAKDSFMLKLKKDSIKNLLNHYQLKFLKNLRIIFTLLCLK